MEILLKREVFNDDSTLGRMSVNGQHLAFVVEDKVRELGEDCKGKVMHKTAIPPGRYEVALTYSNRFKKYLPLVMNVPCFVGIRIHGGNTHENSSGCPCIGLHWNGKDRVWGSAPVMTKLLSYMKRAEKKEKIFLTVQ